MKFKIYILTLFVFSCSCLFSQTPQKIVDAYKALYGFEPEQKNIELYKNVYCIYTDPSDGEMKNQYEYDADYFDLQGNIIKKHYRACTSEYILKSINKNKPPKVVFDKYLKFINDLVKLNNNVGYNAYSYFDLKTNRTFYLFESFNFDHSDVKGIVSMVLNEDGFILEKKLIEIKNNMIIASYISPSNSVVAKGREDVIGKPIYKDGKGKIVNGFKPLADKFITDFMADLFTE